MWLRKIIAFPILIIIRLYQILISPLFPPSCRFTPSCSNYSLECYKKHNIFKATILSTWRVLRCNPYNIGGFDPPPKAQISISKAFKNIKKRKGEFDIDLSKD